MCGQRASSLLSSYHVGPGNQIQFLWLGSRNVFTHEAISGFLHSSCSEAESDYHFPVRATTRATSACRATDLPFLFCTMGSQVFGSQEEHIQFVLTPSVVFTSSLPFSHLMQTVGNIPSFHSIPPLRRAILGWQCGLGRLSLPTEWSMQWPLLPAYNPDPGKPSETLTFFLVHQLLVGRGVSLTGRLYYRGKQPVLGFPDTWLSCLVLVNGASQGFS